MKIFQESKKARKQESKKARKQESKKVFVYYKVDSTALRPTL
jgi:hypothetical protein